MVDKEKLFKYRLLEKNLSQRELANILNISYNTVNTWITKETPQNIRQYLQMLSILDISIDEIEHDINK